MQVLAQEEYGLRCLLDLARHPGPELRTIHEVAAAEGLSMDYTAKLLRELRRGGLVASTRGAAGGYRLSREPETITVWDAIQVLGGGLFPESFCACHPGQRRDCVHRSDCSIRALWQRIDASVRQLLSDITLADLQRGEGELASRLAAQLETPKGAAEPAETASRALPPQTDRPRRAP